MIKAVINVIDYLENNKNAYHYNIIFSNLNINSFNDMVDDILFIIKFTLLKIRLRSDSFLPNMGTRSHHRFGYARRRSMIIRASIPIAFVP